MSYSHLDLARLQARTLFLHDANGRMLSLNELEPDEPTPLFFLSRTREGNVWSTRNDLPDQLTRELGGPASTEPPLVLPSKPPVHLGLYMGLLLSHEPEAAAYHGSAYFLPKLEQPTGTTTISAANRQLLLPHFPYTHTMLEQRSPVVVVVEAGAAVSACYSVRTSEGAVEAGVDTVDGFRGRGYAGQVVRGWANGVRALGKIPLYSTSWDNTASQSVARKLGAVLYAANFHIA